MPTEVDAVLGSSQFALWRRGDDGTIPRVIHQPSSTVPRRLLFSANRAGDAREANIRPDPDPRPEVRGWGGRRNA